MLCINIINSKAIWVFRCPLFLLRRFLNYPSSSVLHIFFIFFSMWTDDPGDPGLGHIYRLCLSQCSAVPDRCHAHTSPLCPEKCWRITSYCMPTQSKPRWREIHPRSTTARPSNWCHVDISWRAAVGRSSSSSMTVTMVSNWLQDRANLAFVKKNKYILLNLTGCILMNS